MPYLVLVTVILTLVVKTRTARTPALVVEATLEMALLAQVTVLGIRGVDTP